MAKITIKRKTSTGVELLYPTTTLDQIISEGTGAGGADESLSDYLTSTYIPLSQKGANLGVAPLDSNGKIYVSDLPTEILGGLKFIGALTTNTDLDLLGSAYEEPEDVGSFWIATSDITLSTGNSYSSVLEPGDEGDYTIADGINIEAGDWVILTATGTNSYTFAIVDNDYTSATTNTEGTVTLSSAGNVGVFHLTNNPGGLTSGSTEVITENSLLNMMGTGANTIAYGNHNHSGVYEPVFTKNTAFNKDFGSTAGTVAEGNHNHNGTYLRLSGADTMTGDLQIGAEGTGTTEDSLSITFKGRAVNVDFTKELKMPTTGELTFGGKRVYTLDTTSLGRLFWDTETGAVEGDFIFDDDATA